MDNNKIEAVQISVAELKPGMRVINAGIILHIDKYNTVNKVDFVKQESASEFDAKSDFYQRIKSVWVESKDGEPIIHFKNNNHEKQDSTDKTQTV